jgi:hypothetical protein
MFPVGAIAYYRGAQQSCLVTTRAVLQIGIFPGNANVSRGSGFGYGLRRRIACACSDDQRAA